MIPCPKCTAGKTAIDEDGRRYIEDCYFCCGAGKVNDEQFRQFQVDQLIGEIAVAAVELCWDEGCAELAAESGMSSRQLKEEKVYSLGRSIADTINNLPREVQNILMARFMEV